MSGIVAVGGESEEGGGSSACLSRPDSDGCGDFTGLFLDSCVYVWESERKKLSANVLYSDCSPQFKSTPANSRESKQTHCLIGFGSLRVFAQGHLIFMSFSSYCGEARGHWCGGFGIRLSGEWFSENSIGTWRFLWAYIHRGGQSKCFGWKCKRCELRI